jgi:hypothetical protein
MAISRSNLSSSSPVKAPLRRSSSVSMISEPLRISRPKVSEAGRRMEDDP